MSHKVDWICSLITVESITMRKQLPGLSILVFLTAVLFALKYLMPISAEDYLYIDNWQEGQYAALHWNSRLGEILFRIKFFVLSPFVWLISAIGTVFFFVCIFLLAFRRFPRLSSVVDVALVLIPVLCIAFMPFEFGVLTIMDQWGNYIFSSLFFILAYTPIAIFVSDHYDFFQSRSYYWRRGYYFLALFAAWSHELVALSLMASCAWMWLYFFFSKKISVPRWSYFCFAPMFLGFLLTLIGVSDRVSVDPQVRPWNFMGVLHNFYQFSSAHIITLIALWLLLLRKSGSTEKLHISSPLIFPNEILIVLLIIFVMGIGGFYPPHTHVFALLFIFAVMLRLCARHMEMVGKHALWIAYPLVGASLGSLGTYTLVAALPMHVQRTMIDAQIEDQLRHGNTTITVPYETVLTKDCYHYFLNNSTPNLTDPNAPLYVRIYYSKKFKDLPAISEIVNAPAIPDFKKHWVVEKFNGCL